MYKRREDVIREEKRREWTMRVIAPGDKRRQGGRCIRGAKML